MAAYFVVDLDVTNNNAEMQSYREAVPATLAQYGGRFLVRGGTAELIEGEPAPKRIVILEFADAAGFKRWYNSPEYQKILPDRRNNSTSRAFVVDGVGWRCVKRAQHRFRQILDTPTDGAPGNADPPVPRCRK